MSPSDGIAAAVVAWSHLARGPSPLTARSLGARRSAVSDRTDRTPMTRRSYEASFSAIVDLAGADGRPVPQVTQRPRHDDDDYGPSLFRTQVSECNLERLTLPGLFVGRSLLTKVSFSGSLLRMSTLCWCDFVRCWFDRCDLRESDLRASDFRTCDFRSANLAGCDVRHAVFDNCRFDKADVAGLVASEDQRTGLRFTAAQAAVVSWVPEPGEPPPGG
jgi:uncharacterized protein YjbI with pentapeptide repeats